MWLVWQQRPRAICQGQALAKFECSQLPPKAALLANEVWSDPRRRLAFCTETAGPVLLRMHAVRGNL